MTGRGAGAARRRHRATVLAATAAIAVLLVLDLARAPQRQWSARALVAVIGVYQSTVSPVLGRIGQRCRFVPTCSHYAADAVRRDGALKGSARAILRIARCGPWTPLGTVDPA
jgi:putative membrane protein insertion efficiency factor